MAESDQEIRTRGDRDAAVKETVLEFNKVARGVNRVIQEINFASANPNVEVDELLHYSERYKSILIELSSLYDRICELSLDSTPPPKVVEVFERIDSEGCKISADISSLVREISSKENWLNLTEPKGIRLKNCIGLKLSRPNLLANCVLKCLEVVSPLQSLTFSQVILSNLLRGSTRFKHL